VAQDRLDDRRSVEQEYLYRLGEAQPGGRRLAAVQGAHLLCLREQQLALRALTGSDVLDHQVEGALAPSAKVAALSGAEARPPGQARIAAALHAPMQVAHDGGGGIGQASCLVSLAARLGSHRLQAGAQESSMTAGGLVALHVAHCCPPTQGVWADADQPGSGANGQPRVLRFGFSR